MTCSPFQLDLAKPLRRTVPVTPSPDPVSVQGHLFFPDGRSKLDQLLSESKLYRRSADYFALLEFVARLRSFAPFNAMLLQLQKPGLRYAATREDWWMYHGRRVADGARPLLILWPFGPVALVYDVADTEGEPLPDGVVAFRASGRLLPPLGIELAKRLQSVGVELVLVDHGDGKAGMIRRLRDDERAVAVVAAGTPVLQRLHAPGKVLGPRSRVPPPRRRARGIRFVTEVNGNHPAAVQFGTVAHELAHLFLGHLGADEPLGIPKRERPPLAQAELEAESVSYLVCARREITTSSQEYLSTYVAQHTTTDDIDLYRVMWAAGKVEEVMG